MTTPIPTSAVPSAATTIPAVAIETGGTQMGSSRADDATVAAAIALMGDAHTPGVNEPAYVETPPAAPVVPAAAAPATPPAPVVDPAKDPLHSRMTSLMKREREITLREQRIKAQEKEFATKGGAPSKEQIDAQVRKAFDADPFEFIKSHGYDYDTLTQMQLGGDWKKFQQDRELRSKITQLEADRAEDAKKAALEKEQQAINNWRQEQKSYIQAQGDKFEFINSTKRYDLVEAVVNQYYEEHPELPNTERILTHEAAATMVEAHLEKEIEGLTSLKKFKAKYQAAPAPAPQAPKTNSDAAPPTTGANSQTLTNAMAQGTSSPDDPDSWSDEERRKRAMALL